jgi:hypothetical protein
MINNINITLGQAMAQEHLESDGLLNIHDSAHSNRLFYVINTKVSPICSFAILAPRL